MKKLNTLRLIILLIVLLLIYGATEYFSSTGRSKSLRSELVTINPESITGLSITRDGVTIRVSKSGDNWKVEDGEYSYKADASKIANAVSTLQTISPSRIATRSKNKWKEFQVDSTGTRVEVFEGDEKVLDIVLGRLGMGMQGQQQFHTYVRLFDENDVYVAQNFMSFSLPSDAGGFRNGKVVALHPDSIQTIVFNYPDSSFTLQKNLDGKWLLDQSLADSVKVVSYFNSLRNKSSSKFYKGDPEIPLEFQRSIDIQLHNSEIITISAQDKESNLIQSSANPESTFNDSDLFNALFLGRTGFLLTNQPQ